MRIYIDGGAERVTGGNRDAVCRVLAPEKRLLLLRMTTRGAEWLCASTNTVPDFKAEALIKKRVRSAFTTGFGESWADHNSAYPERISTRSATTEFGAVAQLADRMKSGTPK